MYQLLDSGDGEKFERFGEISIIRPCPVAIWEPTLDDWDADCCFTRERGWTQARELPESWTITVAGLKFILKRTDFGHLGIFPEQEPFWKKIQKSGAKKVLNLFAYSGGASLAAAKAGAEVTHVDAAKGMVHWASENAKLNDLNIRWIVEDARKFVMRAVKRGDHYDGIILDPPTFGRGKSGEVFKIEYDLLPLLHGCVQLLKDAKFMLLSCHTPGFTPIVLKQLLPKGDIDAGEMVLEGPNNVPSGAYAYFRES